MSNSKTGWVLFLGLIVYSAVMAWGIQLARARDIEWIAIGGVVFVVTVLVGSIVLISLPVRRSKLPPDE